MYVSAATIQVFDFLKTVIVKCYKDEDRRVASKWMQGLLNFILNAYLHVQDLNTGGSQSRSQSKVKLVSFPVQGLIPWNEVMSCNS